MLPFIIGLFIGAVTGFGIAAFLAVAIEEKKEERYYDC